MPRKELRIKYDRIREILASNKFNDYGGDNRYVLFVPVPFVIYFGREFLEMRGKYHNLYLQKSKYVASSAMGSELCAESNRRVPPHVQLLIRATCSLINRLDSAIA